MTQTGRSHTRKVPPKLYVHRVLNHGEGNWTHGYELASPAELLEAARPHADLEAAVDALALVVHRREGPGVDAARKIVMAALGADDE